MSATAEFLYNRDVNGLYYINANLPAAQTAFSGADTPRRAGTTEQPHQRATARQPTPSS